MPKNDPGSLAPEDVADVVAYLLKMNAMPVGKDELYRRRRFAEEVPDRCASRSGTLHRNEEEAMTRRWLTGWPRNIGNDVLRRARFVVRRVRAVRDAVERASRRATLVRGNEPGEWRYWGADAWSTRYSRARPDQRRRTSTRCRSRGSGTPASVRRRRVLSHDAALRERPPLHRRHDAPQGVRDRSRHGQDALAVGARRRHSLAEGAAPVRRSRARVLDRRHERARRSSSRRAITSRRSTRRRASPIRSSARTASSTSMEGLGFPLVPLAVDDYESARSSAKRTGAQGEAGREVECRRRRPAPTARSASIRRTVRSPHSSPRDRRRRRDRRRQLGDPRLLPAPHAQHSGHHSRLRRAHRQAALEVQSHSAAGRVRRRDVEERHRRSARRASARTIRGRRTPPIPSSVSSTSRSACR